VIHPIHHLDFRGNEQKLHDINMDFYKKLIPYAEKWGVNIAIENMWRRDPKRKFISDDTCSQPSEHAAWVDELNHPNIVACLDLGHSALVGVEPEDAIRYLGSRRLKVLHVHDVDYISDLHTLPFQGKLNWAEITKALNEIGYQGDLTYEAPNFLRSYPDELLDSPLRFMVETGRLLISQIEG
jgi:sugar phosphate isomerase/epimerase